MVQKKQEKEEELKKTRRRRMEERKEVLALNKYLEWCDKKVSLVCYHYLGKQCVLSPFSWAVVILVYATKTTTTITTTGEAV